MFTTIPMVTLRRDIDRLLDETVSSLQPGLHTGARTGRPTWAPAADVRESDSEYVLELEVPGIDPSALELTVDRGVLTVAGERTYATRENERVHVRERMDGRFARTFRLPKGFDESAIAAETEHGVLRIRLPKAALPQPRRITVSVGNAGSTSSV
ncbi:MAG: Hsp20/alpha crystallin family protein, partial [Gemmatirosa sp.]